MPMSNSRRQSLRRWLSVIVFAVIGALILEFSLAVGSHYIRHVPLFPERCAAWLLPFGIFGVLLAMAIVATEPIRYRAAHLRRLHLYPPLWISVVLGIGVAYILDAAIQSYASGFVPSWRRLDVLLPLAGIALIGAVAVAIRQPRWRHDQPSEPITSPPSPLTWNIIREWSQREEALTQGPDLLRHEPIANRIHDALVDSQEPTIALIGPIGCGKTSILNMVRQRLRNVSDVSVVIADVNFWSMPRAEDAPRIVLERAIDALNEVVDTQALKGLPETYLRILTAEPTGTIAKILGKPPVTDAAAALSRLTPVLEAIDTRLLVVIEDAERATHPFETTHVERLLWTLRNIRNVSFILSFDPERARFDYTKLCDQIERVPRLTVEFVEDILAPAYEHWRTPRKGHIDPLLATRKDRLGLTSVMSPIVRYTRRTHGNSVADAITDLLTSPRDLKHFIRDVDRAWEPLQGEVELDDLIVLTVLRHAAPNVFDFVVANIEAARSESHRDDALAGDAEKTVTARWQDLRDSLSNGARIQILVDALQLPKLRSDLPVPTQLLPQGIRNDGPVDYLDRILAGRIPPSEIRDQQVLADIEAWKASGTQIMLQRLLSSAAESERYVGIWEHYAYRITDSQLLDIASRSTASVLRNQGSKASMQIPAMIALWRRCTRRVPCPARTDWLIEQIRLVLPASLGFANDLFYYWASVPNGNVTEEERNQARFALVKRARESFVTAEALLASVGPGHDCALTNLVHPPPTDEPPDPVATDSWGWLVPHIVGAAKADEDRIVPDVAILVGDTASDARLDRFEKRYELKRERMAEFFGDWTEEVLRILAAYRGDEEWAVLAREESKNWIHEKSKGSDDK